MKQYKLYTNYIYEYGDEKCNHVSIDRIFLLKSLISQIIRYINITEVQTFSD